MTHSADFGAVYVVKVEYNTDHLGRTFTLDDPEGAAPHTLHGPFRTQEEALEWADTYPDDTDVLEISLDTLNLVQPAVTK